ncbi:TonB-dependent receptor domain-containing protein [Parendozoicomonas haliclonae]|uniref:Vitamin B12 transporter BtuB n=1 Tax=Parendozoicomonas haliclonae TaxID=1960125 RepID=A0A1X7AM47_9GAMM|nr:TonB-dependent receptor [Parendozoicomonas haliclonae]SMA48770.1 Vitamin B12 transporter BtuB precursor [Parendozoicomonas haliclonae]
MYLKKFSITLLPLAVAVSAHATDNVYKMDEVVVTAARTAQTVDQTLASVSVITRKDIEQSQAQSVPELLAKLPGVQIRSNGGPGSNTDMLIRGTSPSQSIVLMDGQRIGSATNGSPALQYLNPDQIERIEVVRGPKASLYGADAIGGVVNIITRKGKGAQHMSVQAGYGSDKTRILNANFGAGNETTSYHIGVSRFITDGYDRTNDTPKDNDDRDAYDNTTVSLKLDHKFSQKLNAGVSFYQGEGKTEYDVNKAGFDPHYNFKVQTLAAKGSYDVNDIWQSSLSLSRTIDESETLQTDYPSTYKTTRHLATWQNDISVTEDTLLTAGFDYSKDEIDSAKNYTATSRTNKAVFLQSLTTFSSSDLQLAVRRDKNEDYGDKTTGNIAYGYNLPADMRLIASYGTAFRAPTFNDLYWPGSGNPDVKPETSKNAELELRGKYSLGQWSVAAFQNDIDDMIAWAKKPGSTLSQPMNVDSARIRGVEMAISAALNDWTVAANLTLLDPKDKKTDNVLYRRAKQNLNVDIDKKIAQFTLGGSLRAQSHSYDDAANKERIDGFAVVDLRGAWQATKTIKTEVKLTNLLNKKYETVLGYNEPSRGVMASVTWTPEI